VLIRYCWNEVEIPIYRDKSAYSYSFNNPISYKDPTGFAPEKEKGGGNRLMAVEDEFA